MRRFWPWALLCLALCAWPALARPYTVDDLLKLERLIGVAIDPSDRWLVINTEGRFDQAARYDYDGNNASALGRPWLVDLARPGAARPLLPFAPLTGYRLGPFSPSGDAVVVYRHRDQQWEAGIVNLAGGEARWLGLAPDDPAWGRGVQWRTDDALLMIALADGDLPFGLRKGHQARMRLGEAWARTAAGAQAAFTVVGSGRYLQDRPAPPARRLVQIALSTGRVETLGEGVFTDLEISPSGRHVATLVAEEATQPSADRLVRQIEVDDRRRSLRIFDLARRSWSSPLAGETMLPTLLSWSEQTDALLVFSHRPGETWTQGRFQRVEAASGASQALAEDSLQPAIDWMPYIGGALVQARWLGDHPLLRARPRSGPAGDRAGGRADWYAIGSAQPLNLTAGLPAEPSSLVVAPDAGLLATANGSVWRIDGEGKASAVAKGAAARLVVDAEAGAGGRGGFNPARPRPSRRGPWLARDEAKGARRFVAAAGAVAKSGEHALGRADGARVLAVSRHGVVESLRDARGVETVRLARSGLPPIPLLTVNAALADVDAVEPRELTFAGPDGAPLKAWLYLPPPPAGAGPPSLIVNFYPGSVHQTAPYNGRPDARAFSESTAVMVGRGYAVLMPSLPRAPELREPAEGFVEPLLAAVAAAAATGTIDGDRVALWGHSFGSYGALVAATRSQRFQAVVALNGPADLTSAVLASGPHHRVSPEDGLMQAGLIGWAETGQGQMGVAPWTDPNRYRRNSPVYFADRVQTPVLLIGADMDDVALAQSEMMFSALWRLGKDAKLVTFWGEGHVVESPANVRALYDQAFGFLDLLIGPPARRLESEAQNRAPR